ncbi:MAG TPA: methyltransferase [Gammaproteobacteria bacterium]|nr:methyltransferase [Gammaproteobacteria bacterium]
MRSRFLMMMALALLAVVTAAAQTPAYRVPATASASIKRAVESPSRPAEQRARDADRKPAETLMLAGIAEGQRVVELASFGQYWTNMLVEAVGPSGQVYMVDMPWTDRFGGEAGRAFDTAHTNATYTQAHYNQMSLPQNLDVVIFVQFYHDLKRPNAAESVDTTDMNKKILAALKPGGIFLVVDHVADAGSGWRDSSTLHRIDPATIKSEVTAAGFELVQDSPLLKNPADDHKQNMRAEGLRGHTDQAVLVFRKPGR